MLYSLLGKNSKSGYESRYYDSGNTIQFSFFMMQFSPFTWKVFIPKYKFFSVTKKQKQNSFLLLLLKLISLYKCHFFGNSFVVIARVPELCWHKILFSNVNWSQFLFSFLLTLSLF